MTIRRYSLALMLLLVAGTLAAGPLSIHLQAAPQRILPGLPFDLHVELTNPTDRQLNLANLASLNVRDASGTEFVATCGSSRRCAFPQFNSTSFTLAPHEKRMVSLLDWPVPTSATWLDDPRLHRAGTYEIQLVFGGPDGGTSNQATLVVEEPAGADAEVLKGLRAPAPDGPLSADVFRNANRALQKGLLTRFPATRYAPYLTASQLDPEQPEALADFLRAHPDYVFRDLIQLRVAEWHLNNAQAVLHVKNRGDVAEAKREMTIAADQYRALRNSSNPYASDTAKTVLAFIADRDDLNGLLPVPEKKPQP